MTAILIISLVSLTMNFFYLVILKWNQEDYWEDLHRRQHRMQDDIAQITRTVKAIDKKIKEDEQSK